jgi:uncharacterized protein YoxC
VENTVITIFVVVAAVAIVVQMAILFALYKGLRQSSDRMEGIATRLEQKAMPILTTAAAILDDAQPKIAELTANLTESSAILRAQVHQIGDATSEIVERVRMNAARVDDFIQNAAHKVEATSDLLQNKVLSPVRRVRAMVSALSAGLAFLKSTRSRQRSNSDQAEDEEMFI